MEGTEAGVWVLALSVLVIAPMLLYLVGFAVKRSSKKAPRWVGLPAASVELECKPGVEPLKRVGE
jgi:hypothetical protein